MQCIYFFLIYTYYRDENIKKIWIYDIYKIYLCNIHNYIEYITYT